MLGGVLGLVAGGSLLFFLDVRRRLLAAAVLLVTSALLVLGSWSVREPPSRPAQSTGR
jgi:hypothetical protein